MSSQDSHSYEDTIKKTNPQLENLLDARQKHKELTELSKKILERVKVCLKLSKLGEESGPIRSGVDRFVALPKARVNEYIAEILHETQKDIAEVLVSKNLA